MLNLGPGGPRKHAVSTVIALYLLLLSSALHAGDWPQFRGPGGRGVAEDTGLPTNWGPTENVRWKADLPGRGLSCPVLAGGRVYVTACSGLEGARLHVLCFDERTGRKLWERQLWATGNTGCHPKTCMAAPTPVADGRRVYALFATADLACFDRDGGLLWYRSLVGDYPTVANQVGMAASPVLWRDVLIVPMDNVGDSFLAGIDARTGKNLWKTPRERTINWTTPLLLDNAGRPDVLFQNGGELIAYDPATGAKRWSHKAGGPIPSPALAEGLVLVPGGELLALRPGGDQGPAQVVWKTNKLRSGYASPLYYQGRVYNVTDANVLAAADARTGKPLESARVKGPVSASPVAADGKIYVLAEDGTTTVVETSDPPKVLASNKLDGTFLATPAIAGGAIYLRSDSHLWCIGAK